jgi:hypothetical protein
MTQKHRKPRSDMKVETFEKKYGLKKGAIKTESGRKKRKDARIEGIREKS